MQTTLNPCPTDKQIKDTLGMIAKNVARVRKEKGVSQLELSLQMGHQSTSIIAQAEAGVQDKHLSIVHLIKIAFILGVDVSKLLEGSTGKTKMRPD